MSKKVVRESAHFKFIHSKHSPPGSHNARPIYIIDARNLRTEGTIRMFDYEENHHGETWLSRCCLGDVNINNHYNFHYLFHNSKDAYEYLAHAKQHTPDKSIR